MKVQTVFAMGMLLTLLACSKQAENYNKITVGMYYEEEVAQLLGKPDECDDVMGVRNCRWGMTSILSM